MNRKSVGYWVTTGLLAFAIGSGCAAELARANGFHVVITVFLAIVAIASWALRPESRKLGVRSSEPKATMPAAAAA